jgi:hypothetical protein
MLCLVSHKWRSTSVMRSERELSVMLDKSPVAIRFRYAG